MPKLSTRLRALLLFYVLLVTLFVLAKPCFVFAQDKTVCGEVSLSDLLQAVWHGLPLDLATAGYATAPLWLLICACDAPESRAHGRELLQAHIGRFIRETSA